MGIFDRFQKKTRTSLPKIKDEKKPVVKKIEQEAAPLVSKGSGNELSFCLLSKPHVSEKVDRLAEQGVYVFQVPPFAEKKAIKKAVESLYKVKVTDVRTSCYMGKPIYRGQGGMRKDWKKAFVVLAKGQSIQLYEGV